MPAYVIANLQVSEPDQFERAEASKPRAWASGPEVRQRFRDSARGGHDRMDQGK